MKLYIPSQVLQRYQERDELYKFSLEHDFQTSVTLPPFLAYCLISDIDSLQSKHVKGWDWLEYIERVKVGARRGEDKRIDYCEFVTRPEVREFFPIQQVLFREEGEEDYQGDEEEQEVKRYYKSGQIKTRKVASRYVLTDLLMRGLYELHRRLEARWNNADPDDYELGSGEKKLKLLNFSKLIRRGKRSYEEGMDVYKIKGEPVSFYFRDPKVKEKVNIFLPDIVHGAVRRCFPLVDFSSFVAYSLALKHRAEFREHTFEELFSENPAELGAVPRFELSLLAKLQDAELILEEPARELYSAEDVERLLLDDVRRHTDARNPYTIRHIDNFVSRYNLERFYGSDIEALNQCLRILHRFEEEGIIRRTAPDRRGWLYVRREEVE